MLEVATIFEQTPLGGSNLRLRSNGIIVPRNRPHVRKDSRWCDIALVMAVTQFVQSNCWRSKTNTDARHVAPCTSIPDCFQCIDSLHHGTACQLTTNRCIRPAAR